MKKHIIGLVLFSFIVSVLVFLYANFSGTFGVTTVKHFPAKSVKSEPNWKTVYSPIIRQAVMNTNDGLFVFDIGCIAKPTRISLYFYRKSGSNTELIATEEFYQESSTDCEKSSSMYKSFDWAKGISRNSNIYVIDRISNRGTKFSTNFDESLAVPVLMAENNGSLIID